MSDVTDEIFGDLMAGFDQIEKHDMGDPGHGLRVHLPASVDVAAIRQRTGNSQPAFAGSIGVPVDTLRQWEQGRRQPKGAAFVLLALLERDPWLVEKMLTKPVHEMPPAASQKPKRASRRAVATQ